ncbi:MAG: hypothetical protein LC135_02975 [Phycisphaerae bacterium]|nr:hypothetical protein [Phycisphaerae bacterium]MCZ2398818.1 hypothetical protein [Phycisphaerae bacterium]
MNKKRDGKPKKPKLESLEVERLRTEPRPHQPWPSGEGIERYQHSADFGHTQIFFKCQGCGLEFMLMTWRNAREIPEAFGVASPVGPAEKITCPECSQRTAYCIGWAEVDGAISTYVNRQVRKARNRLVDRNPDGAQDD